MLWTKDDASMLHFGGNIQLEQLSHIFRQLHEYTHYPWNCEFKWVQIEFPYIFHSTLKQIPIVVEDLVGFKLWLTYVGIVFKQKLG